MAEELTQKQLEELVVGKPKEPTAHFFERPRLNHRKSQEAGRRVYDKVVYITEKQPGLDDYMSRIAQPVDYQNHPEAYSRFKGAIERHETPISVLRLDSVVEQELIDMGMATVEALASAEIVPEQFRGIQSKAKRLHAIIREDNHEQESSIEEGGDAYRGDAGQGRPESEGCVFGGREHGGHHDSRGSGEAQPERSAGREGHREASEGSEARRRPHRSLAGQEADWSIEVRF